MNYRETALKRVLAEQAANARPMSQSDTVRYSQHQPEAPAAYVDYNAQLQQQYAENIAAEQMMRDHLRERAAMSGAPAVPMNPNMTTVFGPQKAMANTSGTYTILY